MNKKISLILAIVMSLVTCPAFASRGWKSVIQDIQTSTNNSSTANLASGATFTGTYDETLGINGIQVYFAADQDCTIYIDQALDNTFPANRTVIDSFSCLANNPCTRTYTSVAPYFRVRVINNGDSTTTSLEVAAGLTPIISPLPRGLSDDGRLITETTITGKENTERHVWVTPTNGISVETPVKLVGSIYDGQTQDPNFWTAATTGSGTVTQDGEIQLDTGTTANSTASYTSVRKAEFVAASALKFQGLYKFVTAGTTDNVRRCGAYITTDGFFFQLDGTTFSIGHRKNSTDTLVNSGSFNGNIGPNFSPTTTDYYRLEIEWTPKAVFWYVDGKLLHKIATGHLSDRLTLPIAYENVNDNGSVIDVAFDCLGAAIVKLGELYTNPISIRLSGIGVTVCKYGAGTLKGIVISAIVNGADVNIYDGTAITDPLIWASGNQGARTEPLPIDMFGLPFSDGLTIEIVDSAADVLAVYE